MTAPVLLSICMATFRRADFLGEALRSIVPQLTDGVELVVVDGASPDHTADVVREALGDHPRARYVREAENSGIDGDYDKAVRYARGEYCWLMTDDDLLVPGAVARVCEVLAKRPSLLVVDASVETVDFGRVLKPRRMPFAGVREFGPDDRDAMLMAIGEAISFIGAVVIRRDLWLSRDHASYAGSLFAHVGVILQAPLPDGVIALGESLIRIRLGNAMWTPRRFEIWMFKWPRLIWSFPGFSDAARLSLGAREPWRRFGHLFSFRAKGAYSREAYRRHFADEALGGWRPVMAALAVLPGPLAHVVGTAYLRLKGELDGPGGYDLMHSSPFTNRVSRWIAGW